MTETLTGKQVLALPDTIESCLRRMESERKF